MLNVHVLLLLYYASYKLVRSLFNSVMRFTITDRDVGKLSAIKIQLVQTGVYQDYWWLSQVREIETKLHPAVNFISPLFSLN